MYDSTHDALIHRLSDRLLPVRRLPAPSARALTWLALWAVIAAGALAFRGTGTLVEKLQSSPNEVCSLAGAVATAVTAVFAAFILSVPGRSPRWALLPLPGLAMWLSFSGVSCLLDNPVPRGAPPQTCFKLIVLISVPLSLALLLMLRRAFNVRPSLTATIAGLAAAAAAAAVLDIIHPAAATLDDLVAHVAAVLVIIAFNRVLTKRALVVISFVLIVLIGASFPSMARAAERPVVVELFTSQGCSSCPPADALLNELVRTRKDLLPLSLHVEYWNRLGWTDPFSSPEATERQRVYAARSPDPTLFTPEMVIDGTRSVIGSDLNQVDEAINAGEDDAVTLAAVSVKVAAGEVVITVGAGSGRADVVLVGYDRSHTTPVGRGENGGRTLTEMNVVRSLDTVGAWTGSPVTIRQKLPAGQLVAVLLTTADGRVVGVAAPGH